MRHLQVLRLMTICVVGCEVVELLKSHCHFLHTASQVNFSGCTSLVAFNLIKIFVCGAAGQEVRQQ